jgi:ATP-binding cassette subfamily A (ABC1) protein 3
MRISILKPAAFVAVVVSCLGFSSSSVLSDDLKVALAAEPTSMDPQAKRFMWMVIEKISQRNKKSAVMLSTQSMEEVEAVSTKLGILVKGGVFRCFGSS